MVISNWCVPKTPPLCTNPPPPFWRKMYQPPSPHLATKKTPKMYQKTPWGGTYLNSFPLMTITVFSHETMKRFGW